MPARNIKPVANKNPPGPPNTVEFKFKNKYYGIISLTASNDLTYIKPGRAF
jgi:hypothetical protein